MIDQEVLVEDQSVLVRSDWLDLSGFDWGEAPGVGRGKLITFMVIGHGIEFSASPGGAYLDVEGAMDPADYVSGYDVSIGIGEMAINDKGIKFTVPSNVSRYIRFHMHGGNVTTGAYTVYAILE